MDIRQAAQVIRDTVDTETIVRMYGYSPKRGFMICPFHGDTDASLKVYRGTGGWHCFGCGRGGSVIDFVMEHEGCTFTQAVMAIDSAAGLRLMDPEENPWEAEDQKRIQQRMDDFAEAANALLDTERRQVEMKLAADMRRMKAIRDKDIQERTADEWTFLLAFDYESQYDEYRLDRIEETREEVAQWRRKARRVRSA